jgi:antirestriction protein ArdC
MEANMANIAELYQRVTDRIVADLEQGVKPWSQPWKGSTAATGKPVMPVNLASNRAYSGVNTLILWAEAMGRGYPTHQWLTFQQAQQIGARVRKDEKSVPVIFVKWIDEEKEGKTYKVPMARWFHVFNKAQLDGVGSEYDQLPVTPEIAKAAEIMDKCGVPVHRGYAKAYYDRARDEIFLPAFKAFPDGQAYLRTAFHEAAHATGHPKRLNREFGKRFGDANYSMEELVAELGAAFLCARTNLAYANENAEYIGAWVAKMKEDNRVIFKAASHASQAADWLYDRTLQQEQVPEQAKQEELEATV